MKNFTLLALTFAHQLHNYIWLRRLRNVYSVELLAIHVDPVSEGSLAHFAAEGQPVDSDAVGVFDSIKAFGEPGFEAVKVDVLDRTRALAGSDERVVELAGVEADPADLVA